MTLGRSTYLRMGRLISPVAIVCLRVYTAITRRPRVRVLVENEYSEILLITNVLQNGNNWSFPGGGVNRGESLASAAKRELLEETGIDMPLAAFEYICTIDRKSHKLPFTAPVFHVKVQKNRLPKTMYNPREVANIEWFHHDKLPTDLSALTKAVLKQY